LTLVLDYVKLMLNSIWDFQRPHPEDQWKGNHKWCNLSRSSRVHILGYANQ